ncbi:SVP1-like protein 2 [Histomonas meleagridis]|uniref:SVP1-like protein 2 n=1 Tax=Histomonas meleagridis TaxID=135588 RepID=UPI00355A01EA|nr:SVP1-like protein 2 [Histomonas meleagridis]KAH0800750.1 SVP1-like protein 2 [Histomonas meleagridis]
MCFPKYICINDDKKSFTCLLPTEYHVFTISPLEHVLNIELKSITAGSCATCDGYHYIALTGLPADPTFNQKSVVVYEHLTDQRKELFKKSFDKYILELRITPKYLACSFYDHIEIWDYTSSTLYQQIPTAINVHAPISVSYDYSTLACTGNQSNDINIFSFSTRYSIQFPAADGPISSIVFSSDREEPLYFATVTSSGCIIKVYEAETSFNVINFKRGASKSIIYSLDFSPDNKYLAAVSQNATIHFFDMSSKSKKAPTIRAFNRIKIGKSSISYISWYACNQIAVLKMNGKLLKITIDPTNCNEVGRESVSLNLGVHNV